jgi:hypothetical protein
MDNKTRTEMPALYASPKELFWIAIATAVLIGSLHMWITYG